MSGIRFTVQPQDKFGDLWEARLRSEDQGAGITIERGSKQECYKAIEDIQRAETYEGKPGAE
jgi:hypothetical protein